jgi:aldehyde dehydrogenase (NAD+)
MATDTLTSPPALGSTATTKVYKNFIDGEWVESSTGETFENRNPADTRDVVGIFQKSAKADVDAAVEAASRAFAKWRLVPAPRRAEIVFRAAEMLLERKEEYSRDMTREMGKILKETRGDTQEAIDTAYYFAGEGRRMFGPTTPSELPNKFAMAVRTPIGVCGMITPWNFPSAIPAWKIAPALICGNTVVIKPASAAPLSSWRIVEACREAGIEAHDHTEVLKKQLTKALAQGHHECPKCAHRWPIGCLRGRCIINSETSPDGWKHTDSTHWRGELHYRVFPY